MRVLVTGGTGSFGRAFFLQLVGDPRVREIVLYARGEAMHHDMQEWYRPIHKPNIREVRHVIGDVRDERRLRRAMDGCEAVVHAAALKQIPLGEANPYELVLTNIVGSQNVAEVAIDLNIRRVLGISSDKAASPVNLYGATKMCMERILLSAGRGRSSPKFCCVRYGNVVGSRGSVIPIFRSQAASGRLTITDRRMSRFWLTPDQGAALAMHCLVVMAGGEVFVPKIPSALVVDIAEAVAPGCAVDEVGIRPGEKLHECLVSREEARYTTDEGEMFVVRPWHPGNLPDGFEYTSDSNPSHLTVEQIATMLPALSA